MDVLAKPSIPGIPLSLRFDMGGSIITGGWLPLIGPATALVIPDNRLLLWLDDDDEGGMRAWLLIIGGMAAAPPTLPINEAALLTAAPMAPLNAPPVYIRRRHHQSDLSLFLFSSHVYLLGLTDWLTGMTVRSRSWSCTQCFCCSTHGIKTDSN